MDNSSRFANAISGVSSAGAPTDNPLGASQNALFQNFLRSSFQLPLSGAAVGGLGANEAINTANAEQAAALDRQKKAAELKDKTDKLKDALEGKNYQVVKKDDGGFDYYDPLGAKINLMQYTKATGKSPADVLKDSDNSLDRQFVADYNNLQTLTDAYLNKDWSKVDKVGASLGLGSGQLKKALESNKIKPDDLFKQFISYYPNVYTGQPQGQTGHVRANNEPAFNLGQSSGGGGGINFGGIAGNAIRGIPSGLIHSLLGGI